MSLFNWQINNSGLDARSLGCRCPPIARGAGLTSGPVDRRNLMRGHGLDRHVRLR